MATSNDTKLTSLSMAEVGFGLVNPYDGQPLQTLASRAETNGMADDFTNYKGPLTAATADGYTVALNATGVLAIDTAQVNGAGVLDFGLPAIADAVSLETERALVEFGVKEVKGLVKMTPENMTDSNIHFGFGTVGVTHGTADSADMAEVRWNASGAQMELRTQRNTGGVTTTVATAAVNARAAANLGDLLLAVVSTASGDLLGLVAFADGGRWDIVGSLAQGHASLPIAGDPLGMYVAGVGVVVLTGVDVDHWAYMIER